MLTYRPKKSLVVLARRSVNPFGPIRRRYVTLQTKAKAIGRATVDVAFDTELLFASGDLVAALLTAEVFGVVLNGIATLFSLFGRIYERVTACKPLSLGFYSMSIVSGVTTVSILCNLFSSEHTRYGSGSKSELLFAAAAFGCWTVANLGAALARASKQPALKVTGMQAAALNAQFWFCLGSILSVHCALLPSLVLSLGLWKSIASSSSQPLPKTLGIALRPQNGWSGNLTKHLTPARIRAVAYGLSAINSGFAGSSYIIPYSLWMFGNLAFDRRESNRILSRSKAGQSRLIGSRYFGHS